MYNLGFSNKKYYIYIIVPPWCTLLFKNKINMNILIYMYIQILCFICI